jgi:hypothetical protein
MMHIEPSDFRGSPILALHLLLHIIFFAYFFKKKMKID